MNELLLTDVHPHMGDATTRLRREEENVSGSQGLNDGHDFCSGARLVATHAGQSNAVLAVRPLHQPGAIESVRCGATPHVRRAERIERCLHNVGGITSDDAGRHEEERRRRLVAPSTRPAAIHGVADCHRETDGGPDSIAGVWSRAPEPAWPDVLPPVHYFGTDSRPGDRTPLDPATDAPQRGELLPRGISRQAERRARDHIRPEGLAMSPRLQFPPRAVERSVAAQAVVHDDVRRQPLPKPTAERGRGAQLVAVRLVAVIPAPVQQVDIPSLGVEVGNSCD